MNFYADMYMTEDLLFALIPMLTSGLPSMLLGIASYVLTALSLYTLASRRGIGNAWLSWVPALNIWVLGSLSDQYRYVVKGQYKSRRKILLGLKLANILFVLCAVIAGVVMAVDVMGDLRYGLRPEALMRTVTGPVLGILSLVLPIMALSLATAVIRYMALYDIYVSMDPANSVMFTVLSILFRITEPFFLFFNRNRDGGMPPRRPRPEEYTREAEQKEYV